MKVFAVSTACAVDSIELATYLFKTRKEAEKKLENEKNELVTCLENDEVQFDDDDEKDYYEVVTEDGNRYLIKLFELNL